ncbi:LysR substrate-binding domain-containing protein [Aurantimonas aggregata]|uniref:LysR substrate-binding domain-containing protein n=1 Tax=Aurantimonas aggregata TaxID=2047720 RepID=UPI0024844188|nr:LysR substrate-binding domain-containing protein [Aurantimonas aggregata]
MPEKSSPVRQEPRRAGFTLRELEVLRALVETGKTTLAAQRLGLSQSAVSRALAELEATLGRQLFDRSGGRLVPNPDALAVNDELGPIFAALGRIVDRSSAASSHGGTLRIAAPPTIAHRFLPPIVARFTKTNPALEIVFEVLSSDVLVTGIAEDRHDIGLTDTAVVHDGVRSDLLVATEAICALPSRHRLADHEIIRPQDLEGQPFVALTRRHSGRSQIDRFFDKVGVRRHMVIETATAVSAAEFVREGLGVALLNPFPIVHQLGSGIVVRPFAPAIPYRACFLSPASRPLSLAAADFMALVRKALI